MSRLLAWPLRATDRRRVRLAWIWPWVGLLLFFVLTLVGILALTARLSGQAALTEVQRLKAELHTTRVSLIQAQAALADCQAQMQVGKLTAERAQLEADFRATLKPAEGEVFDWQALTFKKPPAPKER